MVSNVLSGRAFSLKGPFIVFGGATKKRLCKKLNLGMYMVGSGRYNLGGRDQALKD